MVAVSVRTDRLIAELSCSSYSERLVFGREDLDELSEGTPLHFTCQAKCSRLSLRCTRRQGSPPPRPAPSGQGGGLPVDKRKVHNKVIREEEVHRDDRRYVKGDAEPDQPPPNPRPEDGEWKQQLPHQHRRHERYRVVAIAR